MLSLRQMQVAWAGEARIFLFISSLKPSPRQKEPQRLSTIPLNSSFFANHCEEKSWVVLELPRRLYSQSNLTFKMDEVWWCLSHRIRERSILKMCKPRVVLGEVNSSLSLLNSQSTPLPSYSFLEQRVENSIGPSWLFACLVSGQLVSCITSSLKSSAYLQELQTERVLCGRKNFNYEDFKKTFKLKLQMANL